jgi:hypothetical protein
VAVAVTSARAGVRVSRLRGAGGEEAGGTAEAKGAGPSLSLARVRVGAHGPLLGWEDPRCSKEKAQDARAGEDDGPATNKAGSV